jgi:predicted metal-binding membrane protein
LGAGQRRGTHVSVPKIGSRAGLFCFGGIWDSHADLRRELNWGNLVLMFFWVLSGSPRGYTEEGGPLVHFEGLFCVGWKWGDLILKTHEARGPASTRAKGDLC